MSIWNKLRISRTRILGSFEQCRILHLNSVYNADSTNPNPPLTEASLKSKLQSSFPTATKIDVEDISGGCGAMFQIHIESPDFKGLNTVKQHQLVNSALKDEIKNMHGIRVNTAASK